MERFFVALSLLIVSASSVEPMPADLTSWVTRLPDHGMTSDRQLVENRLLYATKRGHQVTVYERHLRTAVQRSILKYREYAEADPESGNTLEGLPPSVALSSDKKQLAFAAEDGLGVHQLKTRRTRYLIRKTNALPPLRKWPGPRWSVPWIKDEAFALTTPRWSADGKFISFTWVLWEGRGLAIINSRTRQCYAPRIGREGPACGNVDLAWAPRGHSFVTPNSCYGEEQAPLIGSTRSVWRVTNLAKRLGKEHARYGDIRYASDGGTLVFTYRESGSDQRTTLAMCDRHGHRLRILSRKGSKATPLFSPDGRSILYLVDGLLEKHQLHTGRSSGIAVLRDRHLAWRLLGWTREGYLTVAIDLASSQHLKGRKTRLLLIDLATQGVVYASPLMEGCTVFLGLAR
ncbi:MAG: PD40 domain-containing protein [Armatimonadetes bacterium]|nr:PD40 domain-containing protein [Armatimonadota bacterium]